MKTSTDLRDLLNRIDHKGYPAYKDTKGAWQFEGYVGIGILASFIFSRVLEIMDISDMLLYVHSLMNMIVALIFGIIPLIAIKDCIKELLHATPNKETCNSIIERVANSEKSL